MPLSSPYRAIPWTGRDVAASIRAEVENYRREIGQRLRQLRRARGFNSQEDAAHAVGVSAKTWGDWERGKRTPYDHNWKRIGKVFDIDPDELQGTPPSPLGLGPSDGPSQLDRIESRLADIDDRLKRLAEAATEQGLALEGLRRQLRAGGGESKRRGRGGQG